MKQPAPIKAGATIAIISPASPPKPDRLVRGIKYLEDRGYKIKLGQHVQDHNKYLAGTGPEQLEDLHWAFRDDDIDAIICSRGGYGTPRYLADVDYDLIAANPKPFIGYSDVTALQSGIMVNAELVTFSGPMVAIEMGSEEGFDPYSEEMYWSLLTQPLSGQILKNPPEQALQVLSGGTGRGHLIGGCLSLYDNLMGTEFFPEFRGGVLVLEDLGENVQHIDRMLTQFKLAGFFQPEGLNGLMLGQFLGAWDQADANDFSLDELVRDIIGDVDFPIVAGLAYGHDDRKMSLPLGAEIELDSSKGQITLL